MNLSEALDAALPEIPKARLARSRPPMLDPNLIVREDIMDGEPVVGIMQRDRNSFFRFQPAQWDLAQCFDGERTYEEIAVLFTAQTGIDYTTEDIRAFAENLEESDFWYKTPQEKNLALHEKLKAQRNRRATRKSKVNLAHISFSAWDPDVYLTTLDRVAGRFIYSPWSVLFVVLLFAFEATVFVARWNVLGPDIPLYYNFTHKSFLDFAEFWLLLFGLGFIHETAHGLTCKHFGGEVHSMGLMFLYMTPCFFVDVTESWVSATRVQRLATIIAGIWIEMVICGFAMIVWTNTPPGNWLHDFTYKVILITGVAVVVMNLNPLLKLDGYYFLTEFIGIPDLKERSTAFVSAWVQRRILQLPVEVPAIPRKRAPLFVLYALTSGAYSYLVLYAFIHFTYNLGSKFIAEFALLPVGYLAFVMFRSRLKSLKGVTMQLWERHFGSGLRLHPVPVAIAGFVLVLFFTPILRDRENAWFVVESANPATLHSAVSGSVVAVLVHEGERVKAGQPLLRMTSNDAAQLKSAAGASSSSAAYQAVQAELQGSSIGGAAAGQQAAASAAGLAQEAQSALILRAPEDGVVLTRDPFALVNQQVAAGQPLLVLAGNDAASHARVVRVFIPAPALDRVQAGSEVAFAPPGHFSILRLKLPALDGEATTLPPGLLAHQDYKGIELPTFYFARIALPANAPDMPLATAGSAKVFGQRRSLFERALAVGLNLFRAHVW